MSGQEQKNKKKKATLSPLHYAARHGHLDKVKYLVEEVRVDIDAKSNIKCKHTAKVSLRPTALALACWHGHLDVVDFLAKAGASTADESAVYWAAANNQLHVADYLLACGGDYVEYDALVRAACIAGEMKTLEYVWPLAEHDPQLFTTHRNWQEAAAIVSRNGNVEMLQWLHEKSLLKGHPWTNPNIFHSAVIHNHTNCADYLLENKVFVPDVATPVHEKTALHIASSTGNLDAVKFLLSRGANHEAEDDDFQTPLMTAIRNRRMLVAWHLIHNCLTDSSRLNLIEKACSMANCYENVDIVMYLAERFNVRPNSKKHLVTLRTGLLHARRAFIASSTPRVIPAIERSFYYHRLFDANILRVVFEFVGGGFRNVW